MKRTKCPGQDTRFWRPEDVFEVVCGECGSGVEFFKDDAYRRCPTCGSRITNPKLSLGCAQWCQYAKECLGYDPKELLAQVAEEGSLGDQLVAAVKEEFGDDQARLTHALLVLERAEELMRAEGGDPRVVVAAALLHDVGSRGGEANDAPAVARRIMTELGMDGETIEEVCRIVGAHAGGDCDSLESRIVGDADWLVNLPAQYPDADERTLKRIIEQVFRTKTGKATAYRLFLGTFGERAAETEATETERSEG